jgi:lipopolysaccharide transport system permease protein
MDKYAGRAMRGEPSAVTEAERARSELVEEPASAMLVERHLGPLEQVLAACRSWRVGRDLAGSVVRSQLSFDQMILGPWWIPIGVGLTVAGMTLIFGGVLGTPSIGDVPYLLFLLVGLLTWRVFDRSLMYTVRSFYRFRRLTQTLDIPLVLIPVAATAQGLLEWGAYLLLIVGVVVYYVVADGSLYVALGPELLLVPVSFVWALMLAWGVGSITGPIFMRARDVRILLRLVMPFLMLATPVVYPLTQLSGLPRSVAEANPMAAIVETMRVGMFGIGGVSAWSYVVSVGVTAGTLIAGVTFLSRHGLHLIGASRLPAEEERELNPL